MPIIIAILLGLSALLIVIYPLLGLDRAAAASTAGTDALADVAERERSAKMALRDVDFDHRLGNLEEGDYHDLRDRYEQRALAALRTRYEREQALDRLIDEQLAALRDKKVATKSPSGKNGNRALPSSTEKGAGGEVTGEKSVARKSARSSPNLAKSGHSRPAGPTRSRRGKGA